MRFLSIDPSMSNTAIVWGEIKEDKTLLLQGYKIVHTEKSKEKVAVMADRVNRVRSIFTMMDEVIAEQQPDVSFFEYSSGSQSSSGAISVGVSCAIAAKLPTPNFGVTPMDVKKIVGKGTISKDQVMEYCLSKYPDFNFEKKKDGSLVKARMEHVCDAILIGLAGIKKMK